MYEPQHLYEVAVATARHRHPPVHDCQKFSVSSSLVHPLSQQKPVVLPDCFPGTGTPDPRLGGRQPISRSTWSACRPHPWAHELGAYFYSSSFFLVQ
ncbi:hypothetical protein [Streptomyces sp. NPDC001502]|uniref:hypothetical protein n=1 Tax=Streptomyces sp. NPDC001502 TaxID=3364578 RepID=UPI00368BA7CA